MSLLAEACEWAAGLRFSDIPADVVALASAQNMAMAASVRASLRHPAGDRVLAAYPGHGWGPIAARLAALSIALDWDETVFAGHTGHSCVLAPLALARTTGAGGEALLVAQVAATEVAARVTAALTLGRRRGQTAGHTHAAGAVVGCGLLLGLDAGRLNAALGAALRQHHDLTLAAFMGSDAKFGVAADPVLAASALLADDSLPYPGDVLAGPGGLFETVAEVPLPEAFGGYGSRWHLRSLSIKAMPGCAYLGAAAEAAGELAPLDLDEVADVEVSGSVFTLRMEAESAPFLAGAKTPLPALSFSAAYNVATALQGGAVTVEDLHGVALADARRWSLVDRVRLVHASDLTESALVGTAPVGAALGWAGKRARAYLERGGAGPELSSRVLAAATRRVAEDPDLDRPDKSIGARIRVRMRDGRELTADRAAAGGSCQETVEARVTMARRRAEVEGVNVTPFASLELLDAAGVEALWPPW